jgi:hypothetical protein
MCTKLIDTSISFCRNILKSYQFWKEGYTLRSSIMVSFPNTSRVPGVYEFGFGWELVLY